MAWSIFRQGGGEEVAVGWAKQFLTRLGAPVTPGNIEFIYQWEKSEGGGGKYNPLNTGVIHGHSNLVTSGNQYGGGAADYASWNAGIEGAYYGISLNYYKDVVKNLKANNPAAARRALWNSPWAASHYGHGSNWYFGPIPHGTPVLPPNDGVPGKGSNSGGSSGGGGTSSPGTATPVDFSNVDMSACAWSFGVPVPAVGTKHLFGIPVPTFGINGQPICLLSKVQVRQLIAFGIIASGGVVVLAGSFLMLQVVGIRFAARVAPVLTRSVLPTKVAGVIGRKVMPAQPRASRATYSDPNFAANKNKAPKHRALDRAGRHARSEDGTRYTGNDAKRGKHSKDED